MIAEEQIVASAHVTGKAKWTEADDLALRRALEEAQGESSWDEIARAAFPDGKFEGELCINVSLETYACRRQVRSESAQCPRS